MRSDKELRNLKEELYKLTSFIWEYGIPEEVNDSKVAFASDAGDVISWVLEEVQSEAFRSSDYLGISKLRSMVRAIEKRTGKDYESFNTTPDPAKTLAVLKSVIKKLRAKPRKRNENIAKELVKRWEAKTGTSFPSED